MVVVVLVVAVVVIAVHVLSIVVATTTFFILQLESQFRLVFVLLLVLQDCLFGIGLLSGYFGPGGLNMNHKPFSLIETGDVRVWTPRGVPVTSAAATICAYIYIGIF